MGYGGRKGGLNPPPNDVLSQKNRVVPAAEERATIVAQPVLLHDTRCVHPNGYCEDKT